MVDREKFMKAHRRVQELTGFWVHATVFALVIALLFAVNLAGDAESGWWVQWPLLGWGIGVAAHAWGVFAHVPNLIARWQHRKTREIMKSL